jgi:hypothetical protein
MKTMQNLVIHHQSVRQSLGWTGQTRMLASLHLSISSSCTTLATTTHNNKYLAPLVLVLALADGWKEIRGCVESLQEMRLARKLPYLTPNTKTLTLT